MFCYCTFLSDHILVQNSVMKLEMAQAERSIGHHPLKGTADWFNEL